jgi:hypothetical protein
MEEVGGKFSMLGENEKCTKNSFGKAEDERQLGRHRSRWEDNIKMDLKK